MANGKNRADLNHPPHRCSPDATPMACPLSPGQEVRAYARRLRPEVGITTSVRLMAVSIRPLASEERPPPPPIGLSAHARLAHACREAALSPEC